MLKLQQWLLHTDGAEQHKMFCTGFLCYLQSIQSSLVVYCPGVFLQDQGANSVEQCDGCTPEGLPSFAEECNLMNLSWDSYH